MYLKATCRAYSLSLSVMNLSPAPWSGGMSHTARREPAILCISTLPWGSLLVISEAKTLFVFDCFVEEIITILV